MSCICQADAVPSRANCVIVVRKGAAIIALLAVVRTSQDGVGYPLEGSGVNLGPKFSSE